MKRLGDQSSEAVRVAALDIQQSSDNRLKNAIELFRRQDEAGVVGLSALVNDPKTPSHERFAAASHLFASSARKAVISSLKQITINEPWHSVSCGTALIHGGEPEEGCTILRKIAFEPSEAVSDRASAITQLLQSARSDLAIAAFRRLLFGVGLKPRYLDDMSRAFAHTVAWEDFLECCDELLSFGDPALRVAALNVLAQAKRINSDTRRAEKVLRSVILDREMPPDLRMTAARQFEDVGSNDVQELVFSIMTSPEETMSAGVAAMGFLNLRDEFMALDGGDDVVWDKKLSPDEFIKAAHAYRAILPRPRTGEFPDESSSDTVAEALQGLARESTQPIERRFAAAGIKEFHGPQHAWDDPFWAGVEAICKDEVTPIRLRLPAILLAIRKDPSRIESERAWSEHVEIGHLNSGYIYLVAKRQDSAQRCFHLALKEEIELRVKVRVLKELRLLGDTTFAGRQAASALLGALQSERADVVDADLVKELLLLSRLALTEQEFVDLAEAVAADGRLDIHDIEPALVALSTSGAMTAALAILEARKTSLKREIHADGVAIYHIIYVCRLLADMGERTEAAQVLGDICSNAKVGVPDRAFACQSLSLIGRTADARARLHRLSTKALTPAEQLAIGRTAIAIRHWSLARRTLVALAKSTLMEPSELVECAKGLAKIGLKEIAGKLLSSLDLVAGDLLWKDGIEALAECGLAERAVGMSRDYVVREEIDPLNKAEALGQLGKFVSKQIARDLIVNLAESHEGDLAISARSAELLHSLGFEEEARSILFKVTASSMPNSSDVLWVADALLFCNLPFTAERVLGNLARETFDAEENQRFSELQLDARLAQFRDVN